MAVFVSVSRMTVLAVSPSVDEPGFGLSLMRSFASQLGGHLAFSADDGTSIQLTFHAEVADAHGQTTQDRVA